MRGAVKYLTLLSVCAAFCIPAGAETLQEALASAYDQHPQLKAERASLRAADENYVQAQAQGRFQASASASVGSTASTIRTFSPGSFFSPAGIIEAEDAFVPRSFSITGQKPLYQGGRVRSLKGQAKYGVLAAREGLRNTEQSILLQAATAYADVVRDEKVAAIRRNNVRVIGRQGDAARDRFEVGVGTRTDIAQADSRMANAEIGLAQADARLQASRAAYIRATGHPPEQLAPIPDFLMPETLDQAQRTALIYNPQVEAARYNQDAARFGIDVAASSGKPSITAQTFVQKSVDQNSNVLGQDAIGFSVNLTVPIFTGGLNDSRIRQARAGETRAKFEVRNIEDALRERVMTLWAQKTAAERSLDAARRQVGAAEIAFEGVQIELEVGTRDALDLLNAEQEVLNARLSVAEAERNLVVVEFQLLNLMGGFDALSLSLPVDFYDPEVNFKEVSTYKPLRPLVDAIDDFPVKLDEIDLPKPSLPKFLRKKPPTP